MDHLPPGFPKDLVKDPVDFAKISWYCRRFTSDYYQEYRFGHFLLAAYASVPALLTPDLLYRIWMNFSTYRWGNETEAIHRVAVADLLLSGLCREIGYELYEMPDTIRFAFRKWLEDAQPDWVGQNLANPLEIAAFVEQYHAQDNPGTRRWGNTYTRRQAIEAIGVRNPAQAQEALFDWLNSTDISTKKIEYFRVLEMIEKQNKLQTAIAHNERDKLSSPHYISPEFEQNALLAELHKAWLQEEEDLLDKLVYDNLNILRNHLSKTKPETGGIELKLPGEMAQQVKSKEIVFAVVIGIDHYLGKVGQLKGCVNDANSVATFLQSYCQAQGIKNDIVTLTNENATVKNLKEVLDRFSQAQSGDYCFFFFAGHCDNTSQQQDGRMLVLHDSRATDQVNDVPQSSIEEAIYAVIKDKKVNALCIYDTHEVNKVEQKANLMASPLRSNAERIQGSLVILNAAQIGQQSKETINKGVQSGIFTTHLLEVLQEGSTVCSYRALMDKVKLRVMQREADQTPYWEAFPFQAADYRFLSDQLDKKVWHRIDYEHNTGEWHLHSGAQQGVRPSLDFMQTYLLLKDGRKVIVEHVFPNYATLYNFQEPDTRKTFDAFLVQSALPKIKIAYDTSLPEVMRKDFEEAVQRYKIFYIDLIENINEAKYLIHADEKNTGEFTLYRNENLSAASRPMFGSVRNAFEFIKQLEYIAQWTGVLEYDNQGGLDKDCVSVSFEVIEGQDISPDNLNQLKGTKVEKTDIITLQYQKINGKWQQPAVRCEVKIVKRFLPEYHISAVLLSTSYGIQSLIGGVLGKGEVATRGIGGFRESVPQSLTLQIELSGRQFNALPLQIIDHSNEATKSESFDYIKIFVSDKPMDVSPFLQQDLIMGGEVTRSAGLNFERKSIDFQGIEWTSMVYPLKVVRREELATNVETTLDHLIQQGEPILLLDLVKPQYTVALKELRAKLCSLGLLDPIITGDAQTPFKPTADGFESMEDTITAQREFCRARGYDFDKETLTKALLTALVNASEDDLFPIQLTEKESDNADTRMAKAVLHQMQQEGYWIARSPNMYNIVYVEGMNPDGTANDNKMDEWNDLRLVIRIAEGGLPELMAKDVCTTKPGQFYTQNPLNPEGAALVALGQYKAWTIGQHQGRLPALVQRGPLRLHRDSNKNGRRDASDHIDIGNHFGINQHGTGTTTLPEKVGKYGAGSFVIQDNARHLAFMDLVKNDMRVKGNEGYLFVGTVMAAEGISVAQNQWWQLLQNAELEILLTELPKFQEIKNNKEVLNIISSLINRLNSIKEQEKKGLLMPLDWQITKWQGELVKGIVRVSSELKVLVVTSADIKRWKSMVEDEKIEELSIELIRFSKGENYQELLCDSIFCLYRFKYINRINLLAQISFAEYNIEKNRILHLLLDIITRLESIKESTSSELGDIKQTAIYQEVDMALKRYNNIETGNDKIYLLMSQYIKMDIESIMGILIFSEYLREHLKLLYQFFEILDTSDSSKSISQNITSIDANQINVLKKLLAENRQMEILIALRNIFSSGGSKEIIRDIDLFQFRQIFIARHKFKGGVGGPEWSKIEGEMLQSLSHFLDNLTQSGNSGTKQ